MIAVRRPRRPGEYLEREHVVMWDDLKPKGAPQKSAKLEAAPLYAQLATVFRKLIASKEWQVGSTLPSESELAQRFGVSVGTTRRALEALHQEGAIARRQGRGTFVTDPRRTLPPSGEALVDTSGNDVRDISQVTVVELGMKPADAEEAEELKTKPKVQVVKLCRRIEVGGTIIALESYAFRHPEFAALLSETEFPREMGADYFGRLGVAVSATPQRIAAISADSQLAKMLVVAEASPLLFIKHSYVDGDGRVAGLCRRYLSTQSLKLVLASKPG